MQYPRQEADKPSGGGQQVERLVRGRSELGGQAQQRHDMRERRYDKYADHKADHERLLDEIREIMEFYEASATYDEPALAERLNDWFMVHFKTKDARLHKFLGA